MKKSELREIVKEIVEELCDKGKAYRKRRMAAGEKSSAYLSGRAVKVCKGQMSGRKKKKTNEEVNTINEFVGKELEARNNPLYDKLVAGMGKSETVEGEMLRAINRIAYRYYNDGDKYFQGYGTETAGPAHSFLVNANHPLKSAMVKIFGDGTNYEQTIKDALDTILDYIESRQGKYTPNNVGDMFDYEPEFEDDEDDEDDYGFDYDDEDDDYYQESALKKSKKGMAMYGKKAKMEEDIEAKDNTNFRIKLKHLLQKHAVNLKKGSDDTEFELTLKHLLDKHVNKGGEKND